MKELTITVPLKIVESAEAESHPLLTWMEFVFADNKPNGNMQGIPTESFPSILSTGQYMPIKMDEGKIGGHTSSKPLGVIRELSQAQDTISGVAAIWHKERPSDVALLRESYANGEPLDISFELIYSEFEVDDNGVEWLLDPTVRAATIVSNPAYEGRTPVLSIAGEDKYVKFSDDSFAFIEPGGILKDGITHPRSLRHFPYTDADGKISETLLIESLAEVEKIEFSQKDQVLNVLQLASAELNKEKIISMEDNEKLEVLEQEAGSLRDQIQELKDQVDALTTERDGLVEYKTGRETEDAEAEMLKSRLEVLTEAGFEFTQEQVDKKRSLWLSLNDDAFGLYVEDLTSVKASVASKQSTVPDVSSDKAVTDHKAVLTAYYANKDKE